MTQSEACVCQCAALQSRLPCCGARLVNVCQLQLLRDGLQLRQSQAVGQDADSLVLNGRYLEHDTNRGEHKASGGWGVGCVD